MPTIDLNADLANIRAEFPALAGEQIYLDNAGGSQVLRRVADRIHDYLLTTSIQLGASYRQSLLASQRVLDARAAVAELIGAAHDEEVVMGGSTTGLMFLFTRALAESIRPGDEIIVTNTDHEANIGGWLRLQQAGATVRVWNVDLESLELPLDDLKSLLTPRTKWVAMTHASNVLGTINPIGEVARLVHAAGAKLCVDGVAYAPHRLVDVQASGADIYVFSFYKVFGPHYAVLWGKRDLLLSLPTLNHHFIGPDVLPYKLQPGNVNFELSYGCAGIAEYLVATGSRLGGSGSNRQRMQWAFDAFAAHEDRLAERLLAFLRSKSNVRIIGRSTVNDASGKPARMPTVSFVVAGKASESIVRHTDQFNIGIRFGDFYARRLIESLALQDGGGVVRVSIAHYNSMDEIDALIKRLDEIL